MAVYRDDAEAEKSISVWPGWSAPEEDFGAVRFEAPLEIDDLVEKGLFLFGLAFPRYQDCNVVFELILRNVQGRRRVALARVCWRSLKGGHTNQRMAQLPPGSVRRVGHSHCHPFDLNWLESEGKMRRGDLPNAVPIGERLQSFELLLEFTGKLFRIKNMELVAKPNWRYDLLYDPVRWDDS